MMTNSKKILCLVASVTFLFFSCKKNNDDQIDSEQYYKAQLEKLIHLKEIPSSPGAKSTSGFKTYKEAYEAFSFVRTGAVFSVTTAVTPVKSSGTNQARTANDQSEEYSITPNLTASVGPTSSLGCRFTIDFRCIWQEGPNPDEWVSGIVVTRKTEPIYSYSGIGKMTSYGSTWSGLTFKGQIQGETVVAGTTTSWFINAHGGIVITAPTRPGEMVYMESTLQAKAI